MLKNLKNKLKNKKGFTLVELIVVIVIILILGATMVPMVNKYINQASLASTKQDAATLLTQLQVDVAESYMPGHETIPNASYNKVLGVDLDTTGTLPGDKGTDKQAYCEISSEGEVVQFEYQDGKHYATWTKEAGWTLDGTADGSTTTPEGGEGA